MKYRVTKRSKWIMLVTVVALLLSGCTMAAPVAPAAPTGAEGGAAASGAPVELVYATHNHAQSIPLNEAIIAEFEETHPNVTITFDNAPHENYEQKRRSARRLPSHQAMPKPNR